MFTPEEVIYTVSMLNHSAKQLLEQRFASILLAGEISNFSAPASGHWYFTLKDDAAQVRCAMFRLQQNTVRFVPHHGLHVVLRAKVSLYPQRGEFQLMVTHMETVGAGILQQRFEQLKAKLLQEGLFDHAHKIPLPHYPRNIAVITSATGAALQDVLTVLKRRYPIAQVILYPTLVQGAAATDAIVRRLQQADHEKRAEVILLTRGGGSLEDLWCFNEEKVARAIYACRLPLITGIGHEIDVTIADFVADVRAPTPSAAAETLVPDKTELAARFAQQRQHLLRLLHTKVQHNGLRLHALQHRLQQQHPKTQLQAQQKQLAHYQQQLTLRIQTLWAEQKNRLAAYGKQLHQLSPLNTLERGYAILFKEQASVTSIQKINRGDTLNARLKDGMICCQVTATHPLPRE